MKILTTSLLSATLAVTSVHATTLVVIDNFASATPPSFVSVTSSGSTTNTFAAGSAIGGYRTLGLTSTGGSSFVTSFLAIDDGRLSLSTPDGATTFFSATWGGAGGTDGLGGLNLVGTSTNLADSSLQFSLIRADASSSYTWTFTDTLGASATYVGNFPQTSTTNAISIGLNTFSGTINWKSINFISLSGGGVPSMDLSFGAGSLEVKTVPEPSTYAMLVLSALGLAIYVIRRRQRA